MGGRQSQIWVIDTAKRSDASRIRSARLVGRHHDGTLCLWLNGRVPGSKRILPAGRPVAIHTAQRRTILLINSSADLVSNHRSHHAAEEDRDRPFLARWPRRVPLSSRRGVCVNASGRTSDACHQSVPRGTIFSRTATQLMVVGLAAVITAPRTEELPRVRTAVCEFIQAATMNGRGGRGNNRDLHWASAYDLKKDNETLTDATFVPTCASSPSLLALRARVADRRLRHPAYPANLRGGGSIPVVAWRRCGVSAAECSLSNLT